MDLRLIKRALRKQAIADRAQLVARIDPAAAALAIRDRFLETFAPTPVTVVSAFWPVGEELNIKPLIEALHARGCVCALPVVTVKHMPLTFRVWEPGMPFIVSSFGIPEPGPDRPPATPDISLVPLLAFDEEGFRLGYGGGYYDHRTAPPIAARSAVSHGRRRVRGPVTRRTAARDVRSTARHDIDRTKVAPIHA